MTKLLKTNTAEENIELVRACGTQEEMTELLNTATKEMLIAINNEVYAIRPLSLNIRRMKKHEIVSAIATQIYGQKEAECEAEIISEIESKLPEEKQEFLENCSDDFLEDMCWA